ncbi:MAG: HD domain-containing protein [Planctomycetia bacterium]|nr:HD domain-containing protein [Planctomycetia bacterium]
MSEAVMSVGEPHASSPARNSHSPDDAHAAGHGVAFTVDNLVVGRRIRFPIFDQGGILLLAAGSVINPRFKELLASRGLREVFLNPADVLGMAAADSRQTGSPAAITFDFATFQPLEELIDSRRLFMEDTGPKFKDRILQQGCTGFNPEQQDLLVRKHTEACWRLDRMIKAVSRGNPPDIEEIATIVSDHLVYLVADSDCVIDILARRNDYAGVAQHCLQMSLLGMIMAIEAGMSENDIRLVGLCGLVHDWGITYVPEHIRNADHVLTQIEFLEIQKHPIYTLDLLHQIKGIHPQAPIVCYQVHERPNGTGYPRGRWGSSIHRCARILHVADAYTALLSPRPFRRALDPYAVLEYLIRQAAERMVDAEAVRTLLYVVSQFPIGSSVQLSDGRQARVVRRNGNNYSSPIVQIVQNADGTPADASDTSQIIDPSQHQLTITKVLPTEGHFDIEASRESVVLNRERE